MRMRRVAWLAWLVCACNRGAPANTPDAIGDRFMDLYFVEIDQEKALSLTDGPARQVLDKELEDVRSVREGGYGVAQAKGEAYYERTYRSEDASDGTARMIYDLRLEHGRDQLQRHVLLTLRTREGKWRVTSFTVRDGPAPKRP